MYRALYAVALKLDLGKRKAYFFTYEISKT